MPDAAAHQKPGPKGERLQIERPWEEAVRDALKVRRPADGWPEEAKKRGKKGEKPAKKEEGDGA